MSEMIQLKLARWRSWFVACFQGCGLAPAKLVDFHDAENRLRPCRIIIRHEKDSLSVRLAWMLSDLDIPKEKSESSVVPSIFQVDNQKISDFELSPIRTIRIQKGTDVFGLSVNIVDTGVMVTSVTPGSACDHDGRLNGGDILVAINGCSLLDAEPRVVGEVLRSVDKSTSDIIVRYIPEDSSEQSSNDVYPILRRPSAKSDEEEDEYFDVPEMEPSAPPPSYPPTLVSKSAEIPSYRTVLELDKPPREPEKILPITMPPVESKLSPIQLPTKPTITAPKPTAATISALSASSSAKLLDVGSMVSKVKPTVPFKPIRTSLSPKDAFPARAKSKPTTIESMLGETNLSIISRQWGPERTIELNRDPAKGLGISIISGKLDVMRGGIFIKNVLPDSPAGWNGTLKRGDRILEVNGVDIRNAGHAKAVDVIKNASNPVKFIIQSLVPLPKKPEKEVSSVAGSPADPTPQDLPKPLDTKLLSEKVSKDESFLAISPTADLRSASSSNSSSRESTIKRRSSSKSIPSSIEAIPAVGSPSEKKAPELSSTTKESTGDTVDEPEEEESEDKVAFEPLAEGKVWSKKGKQVLFSSQRFIEGTHLFDSRSFIRFLARVGLCALERKGSGREREKCMLSAKMTGRFIDPAYGLRSTAT
ncbi:multiple PDZ domain protein [Trichonephila clavipes]|uniref:Multiple PDZ domain protein n=1 Tax=Trichonephila clavipes TaxID=2585209 RepID=A0A8X6SNB8_TRICX|nr:multiple PDZ domain protein [Trichonephila clavipes]